MIVVLSVAELSAGSLSGSFASAVFGVVLATGAVSGVGAVASYAGYITTWVICGVTALVCAILLFFVPKLAFADVEAELLPGADESTAQEPVG